MKNKIPLLACAFGFQIAIALIIFALAGSRSSDFDSEALVSFERSQLDKLVISDSNNTVTLIKDGQLWKLDSNKLGVNKAKVDTLLDKVFALQTTWPVTTSSSSHERFDVSEKKYRRKMTLQRGDKTLAVLYVGSSPGFKKSHLRIGDQNDIYALEFNAHDVPASEKDWLDKSLLGVKSLTSIKGRDYSLSKEADLWQLSAPLAGHELDQEKVKSLVRAIGSFNVMAVAEDVPEFTSDKSIELRLDNGVNHTLTLIENDDGHYVKRTGINHVFTLSKYEYERLTKLKIDLTSVISESSANKNETKNMVEAVK